MSDTQPLRSRRLCVLCVFSGLCPNNQQTWLIEYYEQLEGNAETPNAEVAVTEIKPHAGVTTDAVACHRPSRHTNLSTNS
jgi:hypothetical protein